MAYHIYGGKPLSGEISVQGSKNGALPLLAATILIDGVTIIEGCPEISDVDAMLHLLEILGCRIVHKGNAVMIDSSMVKACKCPCELMQAMRSSILLLGPLVSRCKLAYVQSPGGCVIGKRPIDMHLSAICKFGASIEGDCSELEIRTDKLKATTFCLPFPSVGVSELVIMAAVLADGESYLHGMATEPEVCQLCEFLNQAGACILGIGTRDLYIRGQKRLHGLTYQVKGDRIVAGTYLLGAVATRGKVVLDHIEVNDLGSLPKVLSKLGSVVKVNENQISIDASHATYPISYIKTEVFPGFATDLQSMLTVCLTIAQGRSVVEETIFEDRFKIVGPLLEMGARIEVDERRLSIFPVDRLYGKCVQAMDLRGGAALVLAGLVAKGETIVENECYIKRGYEDIVRDLRLLGADIWQTEE